MRHRQAPQARGDLSVAPRCCAAHVVRCPARAAAAAGAARAGCAAWRCSAARQLRCVRAAAGDTGDIAPAGLLSTARTVEEAAAAVLLQSCLLEASEGECEAYVEGALAVLRQRLDGWPEARGGGSLPLPRMVDAPPLDDCIGVTQLWHLPGGACLLLRARSVSADANGAHALLVEAVTDLVSAGRVLLHWGMSVPWGAHGVHGGPTLGADAGGTWCLLPADSLQDAPPGVPTGAASAAGGARRCSARLRPPPGVGSLNFLLQTADGVVDSAAGREFQFALPAGLMAQLAADAAAAGDCVARISLSLGRAGAAGSVLAVVRAAAGDAGGVVVELFSDAPHALVLQWGVLDPEPAAGQSAWRAPPAQLRPAGSAVAAGGAVQTPFQLFSARVVPATPESGPPATATLQRACLAFSAEAAQCWTGLAFVLLSADGALAWRNDWADFHVPWHAETCAVAWDGAGAEARGITWQR
jgi:hypothetical protein